MAPLFPKQETFKPDTEKNILGLGQLSGGELSY